MSLPRLSLALLCTTTVFAADPPEPKFRVVTIDDKIQIGYGVAVADVDGDGKPDILLADKKQFVWYRNPTWEKFVIAENLTEKDNVCLAAQDLDGDGKCEIAVGAEWNPGDTEKSGAVFYLIPPADRTQKWEPVKFPSVEPTTHRMKWVKLISWSSRDPDSVAKPEGGIPEPDSSGWGLVVVPLHGRGNKVGEGTPVKVLCYRKPADPHAEWKAEVVDESMHMTHNFEARDTNIGSRLALAGREGVIFLSRATGAKFLALAEDPAYLARVRAGIWQNNLTQTTGATGAGEVRLLNIHGQGSSSQTVTIEPMHGNEVVFYDVGGQRRVLTDQLADGHALACGDVLGLGRDQIVVGWRGNPQKPRPVGIKLFTPLDAKGEKWRESLIDDNGMACEDLVLADLDGDGKLDIVAAGRATKNVKVYFNEIAR